MGVHRLHVQGDGLHFAAVGDRGELEHGVEGTLQVGHLIWTQHHRGQHSHRSEQGDYDDDG